MLTDESQNQLHIVLLSSCNEAVQVDKSRLVERCTTAKQCSVLMQLYCCIGPALCRAAYSTCPIDGLEAVAGGLPGGWVSAANLGTNDTKIGLVSDLEEVVDNVIALEVCKTPNSASRCDPDCADLSWPVAVSRRAPSQV